MKPITMNELFNLSRKQFVDRFLEWMKEFNNNEFFNINVLDNETGKYKQDPLTCPLHLYNIHNHLKCPNEFVSLTASCELCGMPMCPDCANHNVHQLSRVTGYMSDVDQWNSAKQQEFKDRQRFTI